MSIAQTGRAEPAGAAVDLSPPRRASVWLVPALALLSYGLAFLQRPGQAVSETRLELSVDPGLFLDRVASIWSATTDLGHVQSGQFTGYLFPMGPWFAAGNAVGLPMWVVERLWFGTLLFLAAWGVVRLMEALLGRRNPIAQGIAALVAVLNPYVVLFASRGTVTLLAYAALPWLMLAVQQGIREGARWRWPALFALLLAITGGGVNAAVIAFALLGPAALLIYELALGADRRAAWSFVWRAGLASALGSAWWAIPLLLQGRYGTNFLLFTEGARTVWATTSMSELLRQLGFWALYTGVGYGRSEPFMHVAGDYLFSAPVIVATFLVPLFAFWSVRLTRGWRYAPFFLLLAVLALLVMFTGFPDGTRLRSAFLRLYDHSELVRLMRTTYKAAPLLSLSLACLWGAGVAAVVERWRWRLPAGLVVVAAAGVLAVSALPLIAGRAIDRQQAYGHVPGSWRAALADADRSEPEGQRTMVLPGELFAWYRWGGTTDPVAPALSRRPVAIREIVPYADERSSELQIAVDDLLQQDRLVPGQLLPLLRFMDVGQVVVAADGRRVRSGAIDPVELERGLHMQRGLRTLRDYGPHRSYLPLPGRSGDRLAVPDLSRRLVPGAPRPGGVQLQPLAGATVLDGDAEGIPELAALGLLDPARALLYAGDVSRARLRSLTASGGSLVFSDSNRRRLFGATRLRANRGPTLGPDDPIEAESPTFDPFPGRGSDDRTVALYSGLRRVWSPLSPGLSMFPQYRPYAALDGRLDTSWRPNNDLRSRDWFLQIDLARPRRIGWLGIVPQWDRNGQTTKGSVSVNGGPGHRVRFHRGINSVTPRATGVRSLRIRIKKVAGPKETRGGGGITEVLIPGLHVSERLRLPQTLASEARGLDLSHDDVSVVLQRTTADFPYRAGTYTGEPEAFAAVTMVDAETGLERELELPAARSFSLHGWGSVAPSAPDDAIDRLAGMPSGWRLTSSSRFEGVPGRRASSAFDRDARTAWVGDLVPGRKPFLAFRAPHTVTLRRLLLRPGPDSYASPSRIRVLVPGRRAVSAAVASDGSVVLPRPIRTSRARLEVLTVRQSATARRRGLAAVAVSELSAPGLRPPRPARRGGFVTRCGEITVHGPGGPAPMQASGSLAALDSGDPLPLRGCGGRLRMPAGRSRLSVPPGAVVRADYLALRSPAPRPLASTAPPLRVSSVATGGPPGAPRRARLDPAGPAWLVLDQSYSKGWRAYCRPARGKERSLGAPIPIDGYANGWRVGPGCRRARFAYAPQRVADIGFGLSALACLLLVAVGAAGALRARRRGARTAAAATSPGGQPPPPDPLIRLRLGHALLAAAATAIVTGGLYALRMGPVIGLLALALVLAGLNVRRLLALASIAIAALPVIYIAFPAKDRGGFSFQYANDQIYAHFIAEAAITCVVVAAAIAAYRLRSSRRESRSSR